MADEPTPALPTPRHPVTEPESLSSTELRARLDARQADLKYHALAIREEVRGLLCMDEEGAESLRANLLRNMAVAAAGGLALGLLSGRRSRRAKRPPEPESLADWFNAYGGGVADDIAHWLRKGASAREAVRRAVDSERPVLVVRTEAQEEAEAGRIRKALGMALSSAATIAFRTAARRLADSVGPGSRI